MGVTHTQTHTLLVTKDIQINRYRETSCKLSEDIFSLTFRLIKGR